MYRDAGIVVPFISNDASPKGIFAPGNGTGSVDLYGFDAYPLGFDCANPYTWPTGALPTTFHTLHLEQSPTTATSLVEFQGGSFDPWGGLGFAQCSVLLNNEFERVFYKNDFSFGVTIINFYMVRHQKSFFGSVFASVNDCSDLWWKQLGQPRPSRRIQFIRLRSRHYRGASDLAREIQRSEVLS